MTEAETRIRIRLSIRVRIPELLQARTSAIRVPYVKEPAGQRDVYGQSGCCPVRFRNTCMFGIAHAARFQHEEYNDGCAMTSKFSSQGLNAIRSAAIKCRLVGSNYVPFRILDESRSEARRKGNRRL